MSMRSKKIIITIDGFSSCGKSTLAKDLAKKLGYRYIDTGAMYRAVTYFFIQKGIDMENLDAVHEALQEIHIDFEYERDSGKQNIILNHENIEKHVRRPEINDNVSVVAAIAEVRKQMVNQQQKMGLRGGIVMDGRDIGTVVFPKAQLKIFLTAEEDTRVERRYLEMSLAEPDIDKEDIRTNLLKRDHIDSTRKESPLRQAEDAIVLDNTHLTQDEQVEWVMEQYLGILVS